LDREERKVSIIGNFTLCYLKKRISLYFFCTIIFLSIFLDKVLSFPLAFFDSETHPKHPPHPPPIKAQVSFEKTIAR